MSNQAVGNVYQAIIEEVINNSRVDFEESGVEESVLEELRQVSLLPILFTRSFRAAAETGASPKYFSQRLLFPCYFVSCFDVGL